MNGRVYLPSLSSWGRAGILFSVLAVMSPVWRQVASVSAQINPGQSRLYYALVAALLCLPTPVIGVAYLHHWIWGPEGYRHPRWRSWWEGVLTLIVGSASLLPLVTLTALFGRVPWSYRILPLLICLTTSAYLYSLETLLRGTFERRISRLALTSRSTRSR